MVIDFDALLKEGLINQDETAFAEFYEKTVDVFFRYLKANYSFEDTEIDDILADFYLKCWNAFLNFDVKQSFSGYVRAVFRNTVNDFFRKTWWEVTFADMAVTTDSGELSFEDTLEDDQHYEDLLNLEFENEKIMDAMKQLDQISQEVVSLKFVEEKSYQEIAEILWISQDTVRQRCCRALKQLKQRLTE